MAVLRTDVPGTTSQTLVFLEALRAHHETQLPKDRAYEQMMYAARNPPTRDTLAPLHSYLKEQRPDAKTGSDTPDDGTLTRLADILAGMVWPDPAPVTTVALLLDGWNTVAVTTLLHTQIPDYPIFGPQEAAGMRRLGYTVEYVDDPQQAERAYGDAIEALKDLRERARYDQVPESHHFLTRIVQTALAELSQEDHS